MGIVHKDIQIGHTDGGDMSPIRAMVDTGATWSCFPASLLNTMHVLPVEQRTCLLADNSKKEYGFGIVQIDVDGRRFPCPVLFGEEEVYLLGATTLEIFNLMVDPIQEQLVPREFRARPF